MQIHRITAKKAALRNMFNKALINLIRGKAQQLFVSYAYFSLQMCSETTFGGLLR